MPEERVAVKIMEVVASEEEGASGTRFVVLQDAAGREMRVFIGKFEAHALALGLGGLPPDSPKTYEAMLTALTVAGATVEEAYIHDLRNERFYARVSLRVGAQVHPVEMRPSDALNLSVRANCPLFVNEGVFHSQQQGDAPSAAASEKERVTSLASHHGEGLARLTADEASEELARMFAEDQGDRTPQPAGPIDWDVVGPRDSVRLARVKQMCRSQRLSTGMDHYHAAMILQHAHEPDDYLLAHELCIVAVGQGVEQAKWLAAASEDRYLMNIGRPQRFATQYRAEPGGKNWDLYLVDPEFSDGMRRAFNVPTLSEAQANLEKMNAEVSPSMA
jgi:bifunctional DNase/RNase